MLIDLKTGFTFQKNSNQNLENYFCRPFFFFELKNRYISQVTGLRKAYVFLCTSTRSLAQCEVALWNTDQPWIAWIVSSAAGGFTKLHWRPLAAALSGPLWFHTSLSSFRNIWSLENSRFIFGFILSSSTGLYREMEFKRSIFLDVKFERFRAYQVNASNLLSVCFMVRPASIFCGRYPVYVNKCDARPACTSAG